MLKRKDFFSIEDIGKVVLAEESHVLLVGNAEAVKQVVGVSFSELVAVVESSEVGVQVIVLLNGFDNVAFTFQLEEFLSEEGVGVVEGHVKVIKVAIGSVEVGGVSPGALGVGHRPGGGGHHTQVMASVPVGTTERVLRGEVSAAHYKNIPG